jgi:hypothetical protein
MQTGANYRFVSLSEIKCSGVQKSYATSRLENGNSKMLITVVNK